MPVLLGGIKAHAEGGADTGPLKPGPEIYQSIGVEPIINCRGTFTIIGGSVERPEVRAAMDAASRYFVQIDELADAVGQRLADLTGAEWGMVSAGCAAGLKHVTAACVTGGNPERLTRIPDLTGFDKTEVVSPRYSRNVYDAAVRNVGVKMITVDSAEEMDNALGPRTAMIYLTAGEGASSGPLSLENVAKLARPKNIPISNKSPSLTITWDPARLHITGDEVAEELARTRPRIALGGDAGGRGSEAEPGTTSISVTAWMMQPGEDKVVAERIYSVLSATRSPRSTAMTAPSSNVSGRWDVEIEFFNSKSRHTLFIEQDGNWIQGSHQGDFTVRDMVGMIEGNEVKLRSIERRPGAAVTFIFSGTVSGNTMSGPIHMGEYLNAKFTAKKHAYPAEHTRIVVPKGPPLAT